ncbi:hypothetical protein RQP46_003938 [Phenoliferia psychrophenolica]
MQHGGEKANDWFRSNLTPHTIASGQLSNSSLFFDTERRMKAYIVGSESEFHEASGFHQLRLSMEQVQDLKDAASVSRIAKELEKLRVVYNTRIGKATFLAIDFETYEMQHDLITEAGWASVSLDRSEHGVEERRETQHAVVKENARFRNRRFAPDARDHFDYGTSLTFPEDTLSSLLHALVDAYSSSSPLFILFHDSRADIRTLVQLGFEKSLFSRLGEHYNNQDSGVFVVDTQQLFQGWSGQRRQFKLSKCCDDFNVSANSSTT